MMLIVLLALGAGGGWFAAKQGLISVKPEVAAIAGGLGALAGGVVLQLLLTTLGLIIGALIGGAIAIFLAQAAFKR